jgi:hypothetical protein
MYRSFGLLDGWFIHPDIATAVTVPSKRDPFLLSMLRIFMTIGSDKFQTTVRAEFSEGWVVLFSSDGINESIRCDRIGMRAIGAVPSDGYPLSLSIKNTVFIESDCF